MKYLPTIKSIIKISMIASLLTACSSTQSKKSSANINKDINANIQININQQADPTMNIKNYRKIYVSPTGGGNGISLSSPTTIKSAIKNIKPNSTIILLDGIYKGISLNKKNHLTFKAQNPQKAIIQDVKYALEIQYSSYINIIGIEIKNCTYGLFSGLFSHHIYLFDIHMHHCDFAIYSGYNTHDYTVDSSQIHDIFTGYGWYALGYHQTLQNSVMYNINNHYMMVRGYVPLGENRDQAPLKTRDSNSYKRLTKDDWTHHIINNTFGKETKNFTREPRGAGVGIYAGGKSATDNDEYYLPPQNVLIINNVFYNLHGDRAISMSGEFGFSKNNPSHGFPILGTIIKNNVTNEKELISIERDPDLSMVKLSQNVDGTTNPEILHKNLGFVNPDAKIPDYHINNSAVFLINKADKIISPKKDLRGKKREGRGDIGAYER